MCVCLAFRMYLERFASMRCCGGVGCRSRQKVECLFDGWLKMAGGQAGQGRGAESRWMQVFWIGAGGGLAGTGSSVCVYFRYPVYA